MKVLSEILHEIEQDLETFEREFNLPLMRMAIMKVS